MSAKIKISTLDPIISLCKRRGFIFPSSEIYGGLGSCYDYGPMGTELKRNIKDAWWRSMVQLRENVFGLDSSIIQHPRVWEASGHVAGFTDPLVECSECKLRVRADKLDEESNKCPAAKGGAHKFGEARQFNLMFKTHIGALEDTSNTVFLRPETAQGIFINFQNILDSTRVKLPFGVAQQGKSFRNEITTRRFTFRTCEFEQMEMEFFCEPGEDEKWYQYWRSTRLQWFTDLGVKPENLRLRDHEKDELAHYSKACTDVEYLFPFGWSELEGIACRGNFDLSRHSEYSGKKLEWIDQTSGNRFVPHVVEPALGTDRALLTFLVDAYCEEEVDGNPRIVLKLHPRLAPYKVAVFPLLRKDGHPEKAQEIYNLLKEKYNATYDDNGNIGKRYRRQDEIGTPICITVDHQTLEDNSVTIRNRDTLAQDRIDLSNLKQSLENILGF